MPNVPPVPPKLNVIALIPARGGSKGIPRKNLQPVAGIPLVLRALQSALAARRVSRVLLSTDDDEIYDLCAATNAETVRRPDPLATDDATAMQVIRHALTHADQTGPRVDALVLLEPTSPFRTPDIVDACIEKLEDGETRTVLSVTQLERNPRYIFNVDGDHANQLFDGEELRFARRQEFTHLKRVNGCVYAMTRANIEAGEIVVPPIRVVEMPPERAANIDTPFDLDFANFVAEHYDF
jgi:CMP-N,N'-diacetyllegionaminic acid synthase